MSEELFKRPYVISWNLTYRCNLACEHCYLDAGGRPQVQTDNFLDRSELSTEGCFRVIDEIIAFAPECITILTGGEPLLRRDILEIIRYGQKRDLWMVVGTNGVRISETLAALLKKEGVRGLALSLDALRPEVHDRFRMIQGAWENTVEGARILSGQDLPFIVQTTVGRHNIHELEEIAEFAHREMQARVWNLYFLVPTGRGQFTSDLTQDEYDAVLARLFTIQKIFKSKMLVNAKCAPHYVRTLFENEPDSPFLKTFVGGAGGCPAGTQYLGIRPNGDVTPCPYLPQFGGNLKDSSLSDIWSDSELFASIRDRERLGGRCGECELSSYCGGCRARAFGITGDYMSEDPLCSFEPGQLSEAVGRFEPNLEYGHSARETIQWQPEATERMNNIPVFVRGMVVKRVEEYCRKKGIGVVTLGELQEIRSRMPASKMFKGGQFSG
jgi:radical SAM protein with 4Fe4S-binding SPASM domain